MSVEGVREGEGKGRGKGKGRAGDHSRSWTASEIIELERLLKAGLTAREIGERLGRTLYGVYYAMRSRGLNGYVRGGRPPKYRAGVDLEQGWEFNRAELAKRLGLASSSASQLLGRLLARGAVERIGRGRYRVVGEPGRARG